VPPPSCGPRPESVISRLTRPSAYRTVTSARAGPACGGFLGTGSVPALLLFALWILLASVHLLRRGWRTSAPAAAAEAVARA